MSIFDPIKKLPRPILAVIAVAVTLVVIYVAIGWFTRPYTICDPVHIPTPTSPPIYDPVHQPPV